MNGLVEVLSEKIYGDIEIKILPESELAKPKTAVKKGVKFGATSKSKRTF